MSEILTSLQAKDFLRSFKENASVEIIEGANEKAEIIKIAKAKGIDLKNNQDLLGFKCIYAFANRPNSNKDYLPEKPLLKALPSMIQKPVNLRHNRSYVVGHLIDYRYEIKQKRVIAYGVMYKSCFEREAKELKKDFNDKKLTVSFEIWSPEKKRKTRKDGVTELYDMTIAGMALLPRDVDPAFEGANVLAIAKKKMDSEKNLDLVFASKYKDSDIIIADIYKKQVEKNLEKLTEEEAKKSEEDQVAKLTKKAEPKTEELKVEETPKEPEVIINPKIKCSNCQEEFEVINGQIEYKCPKCFSILDSKGTIKYPPQIKDFRVSCPSCGLNNWRILENKENKTKLKCLNESCNKIFEAEFKIEQKNELLDRMKFVYINRVSCLQCGKSINVSTTSKTKKVELTCPKCGLIFIHDITKGNKDRQLIKITEIIEDESSEKGGEEEMEKPDKKVEEKKVEETKVEEKSTEQPKEEVKVEAPKEESTEPKKEEGKVEAPKVEEPTAKASVESIPEKGSEEIKTIKTWVDDLIEENKTKELEKAQKTKQEQRGKVVFQSTNPKVLDNKDHFPINDANQARNALARVAQFDAVPKWYKGTLKALQAKVRSAVRRAYPSIKVTESKKNPIRKAVKKILTLKKEIKTAKIKKEEKEKSLKIAIKKVVSQLIKANAEIKKIKLETDEKISLYKANAQEILKRREELGEDFGTNLSDKDILNDDKFKIAKLEKENTLLKASEEKSDEIIGEQTDKTNDEIITLAKKINEEAFTKKN